MTRLEHLREPVAILGMALRLPGGVATPERFWEALAAGEDLIGPVPAERWDAASFRGSAPDEAGSIYDVHGGFLDDVSGFDADFFGIHPREACRADPQQRILLELTWEALERSSINPHSLIRSQTGIWLGISNIDWTRMLLEDPRRIDGYTGVGCAGSIAAGRIAHFLATHGPAEVIDTACSSSLVAVHRAVQSLRLGETSLAIVGGANLILSPELHVCFSRTGMLSRTGRCHTFDDAADGYARGEACCVIVLKRLADAQRDHDPILAVIRGSAVNQDGRSARLTAPNIRAQQKVMQSALADASLKAGDVSYIEAHGTGTPLGDPMEFLSVGAVYGNDRSPDAPLHIGSVKTNLGHAEGAAGLTGLIKTILMLQPGHGIAPHLHCSSPSSRINWNRWPIRLPHVLTPWPKQTGVLCAGVSSFGFSGTNAHVIVASAEPSPHPVSDSLDPSESLLCLSAADPQALRALVSLYVPFLRQTGESFADICRSALAARAQLACRLAVRASNPAVAAESLEQWLAGHRASGVTAESAAALPLDAVPDSLDQFAAAFLAGEKLSAPAPAAKRVSLPLYPFQRKPFWFGDLPEVQWRRDREQVWQSASAEAERQSRQGPLGWNPQSYPERWAALGRLTLAHAQNTLFTAGAFPESKPASTDEIIERCGFQPIYRRLIARWLRNLAVSGVLIGTDHQYRPANGWAPVALDRYWHDVEHALAADPGTLAYFRRCGALLQEVLTGRASALETLFPGGSFALAEQLYEQGSEARYCNAVIADALRTLVLGWGRKRNVRILEVGAGTGGTTSAVVPGLPAQQCEYWFTDVSELFLRRARQKFSPYPFVRYALFDLDRELEEQNIPTGRFDVVVAANVVHASRNLQASLRRIHRTLAPGGALLLIETTVHQVCFDMSIGLIEGWQHFEDAERADHPLLDPDRWRAVLEESGFEHAMAVPTDDSLASAVGLHVILAQRDFGSAGNALRLAADEHAHRSAAPVHANGSLPAATEWHALSPTGRSELIGRIVRTTICQVCRLEIPPDELHERDRLSDLGMDSLIALELRSELSRALGLEGKISSTVAFDTGTVGELTLLLVTLLAPEEKPRSAANSTAAGAPTVTAEALHEMSDVEVEALLKERLKQ